VTQLWRRLSILQTRRPGGFLLVFAILAAVGGWLATRLELITNFADLLSPDQPSVVQLRRMQARTRGFSKVLVVLEGTEVPTLRRTADALVPAIRAIGPPHVESAASGLHQTRRFMMPRAGLYLSEAQLAELEDKVATEEQKVFRRAIGADLSEDEPGAQAAGEDAEDPRAIERQLVDKLGRVDRYPDGYFQAATPTGAALVVVVKSSIPTGDLQRARETQERVRAAVNETLKTVPGAAGVHVGYAGDLLTSMAEYELVRRDVLDVGGVGLVLVLGVVLLFFRTARAWVTLATTVGVGCALTFGVTELTIGHLNVVTAFVFSIVAGNGINFGIIWLARFLEERRAGRSLVRALARTSERTWGATITAACAGGAAYAALGVSSVRGFRHLSVIGGVGMLLCWLVTYTLLPALVVLFERFGRGWRAQRHEAIRFERPFVWLVARAPRATVVGSLVLGAGALLLGGRYLWHGAIEYDMRRLQSDRKVTGELYRVSHLATRVLGAGPGGGMVVLADDARDVPALAAALRRVRDQAPPALKPFQEVHTIADVVPEGQPQRLLRVQKLARRLARIHDRGGIDDAGWAKIEPLLPTAAVVPFTAQDLPAELAEPFTEKDGTRGRLVYIEQTAGQSDNDLHYLLRLVNAFRSTHLPDGRVVEGAGAAVIFADLLRASLVEMPKSVLISLALTALTVVLLFRRARPVVLVLGSLFLALIWMMGGMAAGQVRLNFINFIALPITFGIGVDYPVNIYARYAQDRAKGMLAALRASGGAVILCSLTTNLGYLALLRSGNAAVRSLGAVAVLGETTCLLAAVAALPALIVWADRARTRRLGQPAGAMVRARS
jgi:predicted RND superfamily exporter protein